MTKLISDTYQDLLQQEHQSHEWGHTAEQYVGPIIEHARKLNGKYYA